MLQRIVLSIPDAVLDLLDFVTDRYHGVAEPVEFVLVFRLSWLDHERAAYRPRHCRAVKAFKFRFELEIASTGRIKCGQDEDSP